MKMKRTGRIFMTAALLTIGAAMSAQAGWEQDASGRYAFLMDSGAYARNEIVEIDGVRYGFGADAVMLTGWNQMNGNWYYFEESGAMASGWRQLDGVWYYLDPGSGVMRTGKFKVGASLYCADENGALHVSGFFDGPDGYACRADESGALYRNTSTEDENGNIFKYEDDGRIRIANTSTRNISKAEGGNFLSEDYLTMANYEEFKKNIVSRAEEAVESVKDSLYEDYLETIDAADTYKKKLKRQERWASRAKTRLEGLSVSETEINTFISQVKAGTYIPYGDVDDSEYSDVYGRDYDDEDDDSYTYDYYYDDDDDDSEEDE